MVAASLNAGLWSCLQKWHPDKLKGAGDNPRLKEQALARYHEIQEAYKGERFHLRRAELDRDA